MPSALQRRSSLRWRHNKFITLYLLLIKSSDSTTRAFVLLKIVGTLTKGAWYLLILTNMFFVILFRIVKTYLSTSQNAFRKSNLPNTAYSSSSKNLCHLAKNITNNDISSFLPPIANDGSIVVTFVSKAKLLR